MGRLSHAAAAADDDDDDMHQVQLTNWHTYIHTYTSPFLSFPSLTHRRIDELHVYIRDFQGIFIGRSVDS